MRSFVTAPLPQTSSSSGGWARSHSACPGYHSLLCLRRNSGHETHLDPDSPRIWLAQQTDSEDVESYILYSSNVIPGPFMCLLLGAPWRCSFLGNTLPSDPGPFFPCHGFLASALLNKEMTSALTCGTWLPPSPG